MVNIVFIFGLIIGSFLNVCIYRLPLNQCIAFPPSHCTNCNTQLKPLDLIPMLSYIFLGGRCRYCKACISLRYPLVELCNAILYIILFTKFGISFDFLIYSLMSSVLLAITMIDLDHMLIPDSLNLFVALLSVYIIFYKGFKHYALNNIIGMLIGFGLLFFIAVVSKGAMGGGDIKLMGALGLLLGWKLILLVSLLSFIIGAIMSLLLLITKLKNRKDYIPFGPFIALAAFITVLYGNELISWYVTVFIL